MPNDPIERRTGSWARASLVIHSDDVTADEITDALSLRPTDYGVPHSWSLQCPLDSTIRIEGHIAWLLDQIEPHLDALRRLLADRGCRARIQAAISDEDGQYPMTFDADLLRRLSKVGVDLWLTAWTQRAGDDDAAP